MTARDRPRVASVVLAVLGVIAAGCENGLGTRTATDASRSLDGAVADASVPEDAARPPVDAGGGPDATSPIDVDAGAPRCTPVRTDCRGELECGAVPDGCPDGTIDCGECTGGEDWCAVLESPRWRARVWPCVLSVRDAHPEYFDLAMPCGGDSVLVLEARAAEYVRDVAACVDGSGAIAIVDANAPQHEIRVRGVDDDVADNYPVRVYSSGCTRAGYTSSCTPAMF